jgi:hypothetical protein
MSATLDPLRTKERLGPALGVEPNAATPKPVPPAVRCRQIYADDLEEIVDLLCEGFVRQTRSHWATALEILGSRTTQTGMPRYGYMLESGGRPVGVLLMIFGAVHRAGTTTTRSTGSAWYVRPDFRTYASILVSQWRRLPADIHLNVDPAEHTLPLIEAMGFVRFTNGISLSVPAATLHAARIRILDASGLADAERPIPDEDRDLLIDHFRSGCIALWCETPDGGYPLVFRRRLIKRWLPSAQLIYCRDLEDLTRLAGPVGRYLLRIGLPVVMAATNGPIPGIPGLYIDNMHPMYFRGKIQPRPGDLAYTEAGLFGL